MFHTYSVEQFKIHSIIFSFSVICKVAIISYASEVIQLIAHKSLKDTEL